MSAVSVFQPAKVAPPNPRALRLRRPAKAPVLRLASTRVGSFRGARASASALVEADPWVSLDRCLVAAPGVGPASVSSSPPAMVAPVMKGGKYGAHGAVTLEKSKLDMSQKTTKTSPELSTGGGGGDIGKRINHGGGDGGDDGGDDDDYFGDFDEGDEGDEGGLFRRRMTFPEIFDRKFVDAILQEWYKTALDLPAGLRQAYEMGLVSSAQMVRFLAMNARPTLSRSIYRALPESLSRAFYGRMIADPSFLFKLFLETAATAGSSTWWEISNRGDRIKQEWDMALLNVLTISACNAVVVWSLAPCQSYGSIFRFNLQNTLQKLPNNIFEKSYRMREFDLQKRVHCFFYKAAELCMVGSIAGAVQGSLFKLSASKKEGRLSVTMPAVSTHSLGYGAFLGLYSNLRYQLLCGLDRAMFNYFDVIGVTLFLSTALRVANVQLGETSRLAWLGVEVDPLVQSDNLLRAYNRSSDTSSERQTPSNWFISKNAIVSGFGLFGTKKGEMADTDLATPPKPRRKRVVRKKMTGSSA